MTPKVVTLVTLLATVASVSTFGVTPATFHSLAPSLSSSLPGSSKSSALRGVIDPSSASDVLNAAHNLWIATIDSDIAKMPDNEFGKVFAGGIVVMLGGVVSALVVGAILESGDLYAQIAAESYVQSGDAEFWKNLSEEEKEKAAIMLNKMKDTKEGGSMSEEDLSKTVLDAIAKEAEGAPATLPNREQTRKTAAQATNDVFKDYD